MWRLNEKILPKKMPLIMLTTLLTRMKGREKSPVRKPLSEVIWSLFGAFAGIYLVSTINAQLKISLLDNLFLVGSFGASAVLIYGAPQAEFSQPRNLLGGHLISAIIGVTLWNYCPFDVPTLAALAVSLSITAMHLTRTMHPPGGATALIAIIGTPEIHNSGYLYVLSPIGTGAMLMLLVALVINNFSQNPLRHYPRYWW